MAHDQGRALLGAEKDALSWYAVFAKGGSFRENDKDLADPESEFTHNGTVEEDVAPAPALFFEKAEKIKTWRLLLIFGDIVTAAPGQEEQHQGREKQGEVPLWFHDISSSTVVWLSFHRGLRSIPESGQRQRLLLLFTQTFTPVRRGEPVFSLLSSWRPP